MNRWLASRWVVISIISIALSFYLAITFPGDGGIDAFTAITTAALVGGHFTNGIRNSRNHPTLQPPVEEDK